MDNIAIILAGGKGERFYNSSTLPKQFTKITELSCLELSTKIFYDNKSINKIIVVTNKKFKNYTNKLLKKWNKKIVVIYGGKSRSESSYEALKYINFKKINCDNVLIHDGARPLVTVDVVDRCIEYLMDGNVAVVTGTPTTDTVVEKEDNHQKISKILNRNKLVNIQTPQGFNFKMIFEAYENTFQNQNNEKDFFKKFSDDSSVFYNYFKNEKITIILGDRHNIKLTNKFDLAIMKNYLTFDNK